MDVSDTYLFIAYVLIKDICHQSQMIYRLSTSKLSLNLHSAVTLLNEVFRDRLIDTKFSPVSWCQQGPVETGCIYPFTINKVGFSSGQRGAELTPPLKGKEEFEPI